VRQHFHPLDRSARAQFWRSHDKIADANQTFAEMRGGARPLSEEELGRLAKMHPERWSRFKIRRQTL
jgi:uncharacterized protein Yka (UPF0111/DUF47 family)